MTPDKKENYRCHLTLDLEEFLAMSNAFTNAVNESCFTVRGVAEHYEVPKSTVYNWTKGATPNEKNKEKAESIMEDLYKKKRIQRHPSYGYATEEQIERLKQLGPCAERDLLMKQIDKQTKTHGKIK